ncbi:MAG: hydantoinase/oxoprolinase family protein, partial [Erysipelotrichia bacterium]|nr:hydantoinase/oxoprolinase family protein [Erysipelotrichia bacterium]
MIIGLDVGGTHIDGVIIKNKQIIKTIKKPVNHDYLENSILNVLDVLVKDIKPNDLKQINLSTTIATNAIIEKKVNKVGLILQAGPGLNLSNYDNEYTYFIDGYIDHRGEVVKDYSKSELIKAINYFKDQHLDYIA